MNINEITKEIHENAVVHGWWEEPRSFGEIIALCHSELSEALEEYRNGTGNLYCRDCGWDYDGKDRLPTTEECIICLSGCHEMSKPEGIAVEMIDCMIRILDWCGKENIDVEALLRIKHEYNKQRPYKHGGKVI